MRRKAIFGSALVAVTLTLSGCEFMDFGKWADMDSDITAGSLGATAGREWAFAHPGKTPTKDAIHSQAVLGFGADAAANDAKRREYEDGFRSAVENVAYDESLLRKSREQMYLRNLYLRGHDEDGDR